MNATLAAHTLPSAHKLGQSIESLLPPFGELPIEDLQVDHPSQLVDYDYGAYTYGTNTWIVGQAGDDQLIGTANRDFIVGMGGNDWLNGRAGDDGLNGAAGDDTLIGGAGDDVLLGGDGDDTLSGQAGNDSLWGGEGNDQLNGGAGQDDLRGGSGDDVLIDADVGDRFTGGSGRGEFRIGNGRLPDGPKITIFPPAPDFIVTDFTVGEDVLTLNFGITFDDLTFLDTANGVMISSQRQEGLVLLEGVKAADLTESDFRFADPELLVELQASLEESLDDGGSPGAIAAITTVDGYSWSGAAGLAVNENNTPATAEDRFPIASVTKSFTAVVTMQLAEAGLLSLEDTMEQWLPETVTSQIPNSSEITIRQLLSHTSGINSYIMSDEYRQELTANPSQIFEDWTTEDLLARYVYDRAADFTPGTGVDYNSANYLLLGLVIEAATDSTLESQFQHRIIDPLGLENTFMPGGEIPADYQPGYIDVDGDGGFDLNAGEADLDRFGGAGALISNVEDLTQFAQALFGGELVSPDTLEEMITGGVPEAGLGLGFGYQDDPEAGRFFFGNGDSYGWTVRLRYDQDTEATTVLFRNGVDLTAAVDYADLALDALRNNLDRTSA
ncbi:MAG: serine hydrolase [Cyanobacteria bacterium J06626_4]